MYESGIIDSSFGGGLDCADGCAMLLCSGDSEEPERVREAVLSRAEALLREGIGADYFLRMKRSALGRRIKGLDSFDGTCFRLCAYHFAGFDYFRFPAIQKDAQYDTYNYFKDYHKELQTVCANVDSILGAEQEVQHHAQQHTRKYEPSL